MAANMFPIRRTGTRRLRGLAVFGSALIALTMVAAPASATIIERERFTQDFEFDTWECGYEMHVVGVESHLIQVRADKKLDGNVFFTDNYQVEATWTARRRTLVHAIRQRRLQGHQGQVAWRLGIRIHVPAK